jgi:hypothetical protein
MEANRKSSKYMEEYWENVARNFEIANQKAEEDKKRFLFFFRAYLVCNCFLIASIFF